MNSAKVYSDFRSAPVDLALACDDDRAADPPLDLPRDLPVDLPREPDGDVESDADFSVERARRVCPLDRRVDWERSDDDREGPPPCAAGEFEDDGREDPDDRFDDWRVEPLEDDFEGAERDERFSEGEDVEEDEFGERGGDPVRDGEERSGDDEGREPEEEGGDESDVAGADWDGDDEDEAAPSPESSSSSSTFTSKTTSVVRPTDWWTALDSSRLKRLRRYWAVKLLGTSRVSVVFPPSTSSREAGRIGSSQFWTVRSGSD